MDNNGQEQSGLQKAYNAARTASDIARIARAAASSGLEGAAVEAVRAAWPRILKIALAIAVLLLVIPMAIFISLPHVFFGFFHSVNPPVTQVTEQAMELGNVCMSLEEFQNGRCQEEF